MALVPVEGPDTLTPWQTEPGRYRTYPRLGQFIHLADFAFDIVFVFVMPHSVAPGGSSSHARSTQRPLTS